MTTAGTTKSGSALVTIISFANWLITILYHRTRTILCRNRSPVVEHNVLTFLPDVA